MKNQLFPFTSELTEKELQSTNGGNFAYDAGFFFRELVIFIAGGAGLGGTADAVTDFVTHYMPIKN